MTVSVLEPRPKCCAVHGERPFYETRCGLCGATFRPKCKQPGCDRPWTGSHLMLCDVHEEIAQDIAVGWRDVEDDER